MGAKKRTPVGSGKPRGRKIPPIDVDGFINTGPYEGLYLRPVLDAMRQSAWDWPTAMQALGIGKGIHSTMYPDDRELSGLKHIAPHENWSRFSLEWDT